MTVLFQKIFRGLSICLIPTDREHQSELLRLIKGRVVHPVIKKWLYLPKTSDYYEDSMVQLVNMIKSENSLVGIVTDLKPLIKFPKPVSKNKGFIISFTSSLPAA